MLKIRVVAVETDNDGIVPESLDAALRNEDARLLYTMPTLHNPTGVTTSEKRRKAIARLATAYDVPIVEDDAYGFASTRRVASYLSLAPEHAIYVTSLSKPLTPSLRVAYLATQPAILAKVISALRATMLMTSPIVAKVATQLIESGAAADIAGTQAAISRRRQHIARELGFAPVNGAPAEGMHLWMQVGTQWRTQDFVARALPLGVSVSPGTVFAATPGVDPHAVRICLNAVESEDLLVTALKKLLELRGRGDGMGSPFY